MGDLLLVTGDSSSDRYASRLVSYLIEHNYNGTIYAAAGHQTQDAGAELVENLVDRGVVGLTEIAGSVPFFIDLISKLCDLVVNKPISQIVLMDFPGFNMQFAGLLRGSGMFRSLLKRLIYSKSRLETVMNERDIQLYYYITPQVWAWGKGRVKKLKKWFDKLFVIFPFEESFFKERGIDAEFVGHPLLPELPENPQYDLYDTLDIARDKRIVSFFPGSRNNEVKRHLKPMGKAAMKIVEEDSSLYPVLSAAPTVKQTHFREILTDEMIDTIPAWNGESHSLLHASEVSVVATGTITMEAALAETPMIAGYRLSPLTYWVGRFLVSSDKFAMPNLIRSDLDIPELIQSDFTADRLASEILRFTSDKILRKKQTEILHEIREEFAKNVPAKIVGNHILRNQTYGRPKLQ